MKPRVRASVLLWLIVGGVALGGESIAVDAAAKTVTATATVAKQGTYDVLKGAIEYVVVSKGGKEYETILTLDCSPEELHEALLKIGLQPGGPAKGSDPPRGTAVRILAELEAGGKKVRRPIDDFVLYVKTGKPLEAAPWVFTGSAKSFDPVANKEALQAALSKNIVGLHWTDPSPLFENPRAECKEGNIYKANAAELPKPGTPVLLIFERVAAKAAEGAKRVHVFVSGRVQGVGFRMFVQREARLLGLTGWVKNLPDGRVEALAEGPADKVAALLEKVKTGPRAAKVEKCDVQDEPAGGDLGPFEVTY